MSASLKMDQREFTDTLRRVLAESPRGLKEEIDTRAYFVTKKAYELTPVADRAKIQAELGATIRSEKKDAKGRTRRRYKYSPTKLVYALINARRRKAGEHGLSGSEMDKAARNLIASRLRAVGTMKAGWKNALRILGIASRNFAGITGPNVKMGSRAKPAKDGWKPQAEIEYRLSIDRGGGRQIDPRVVSALNSGFAHELGQMKERLERKVTGILKKAGAL